MFSDKFYNIREIKCLCLALKCDSLVSSNPTSTLDCFPSPWHLIRYSLVVEYVCITQEALAQKTTLTRLNPS